MEAEIAVRESGMPMTPKSTATVPVGAKRWRLLPEVAVCPSKRIDPACEKSVAGADGLTSSELKEMSLTAVWTPATTVVNCVVTVSESTAVREPTGPRKEALAEMMFAGAGPEMRAPEPRRNSPASTSREVLPLRLPQVWRYSTALVMVAPAMTSPQMTALSTVKREPMSREPTVAVREVATMVSMRNTSAPGALKVSVLPVMSPPKLRMSVLAERAKDVKVMSSSAPVAAMATESPKSCTVAAVTAMPVSTWPLAVTETSPPAAMTRVSSIATPLKPSEMITMSPSAAKVVGRPMARPSSSGLPAAEPNAWMEMASHSTVTDVENAPKKRPALSPPVLPPIPRRSHRALSAETPPLVPMATPCACVPQPAPAVPSRLMLPLSSWISSSTNTPLPPSPLDVQPPRPSTATSPWNTVWPMNLMPVPSPTVASPSRFVLPPAVIEPASWRAAPSPPALRKPEMVMSAAARLALVSTPREMEAPEDPSTSSWPLPASSALPASM
mmetsp:Transcript_6912/g.29187  ORF Transcript_6912/g.29187 Transcript_6912/m.29187 type:complete len:501 (+) Transcript_6912:692-2194(+)